MRDTMHHRVCGLPTHVRAASAVLAFVTLLVPVVLPGQSAQGQTLTVIYAFKGGADGGNPSGLIRDAAGNLYGITAAGGAFGLGKVFKLDATGTESVLHNFAGGADGANPSGLIGDSAGNLYGTSGAGGAFGLGTLFKLDTTGKESVLHSFSGSPDGAYPSALIRDAAGNLYGIAGGGTFGAGTVFKLDRTGTESILHSFALYNRPPYIPGSPVPGLALDSKGNLYGATTGLFSQCFWKRDFLACGTVYELDTAGNYNVLVVFNGSDGMIPQAGVVLDGSGNLYGTTVYGAGYPLGHGTVFKVNATGVVSVLHSFAGGADGAYPYAALVRDVAGNLYGTTAKGGAFGLGTVFKVNASGGLSVLHSFTGGADGANPYTALTLDAAGNLYGTTANGGASGFGIVFKLIP
jgi:uncharacterized repeat protein (TIGR03803 family)